MLLAAFDTYLRVEKQYAELTRKAYSRDLAALQEYLREHSKSDLELESGVGKVTHRQLRQWMADLLAQGLSPRTVARKISTVKTYFNFLHSRGHIEANPASRIKLPRYDKKLPPFLKEVETGRLFDLLDDPVEWVEYRDRAILELLYGCGLRRAELIGLRRQDLDLYGRTIRVRGKGNKERIMPLGKHAADALASYLKVSEREGISLGKALFVRPDGLPLYPRLVQRLTEKYLGMVSTQTKLSPHILRHTFATHMLDHGADLNAIKDMLGHSSLAATQVYTHNSITKLKNVYKQAHPRAETDN